MPCYDPPRESLNTMRIKWEEEFRHNSDVAALLCEAMQCIKSIGIGDSHLSFELRQWWEEHKIRDKR